MVNMNSGIKHRMSYLFLPYLLQKYGVRVPSREAYEHQRTRITEHLRQQKPRINSVIVDSFLRVIYTKVLDCAYGKVHGVFFPHDKGANTGAIAHAFLLLHLADCDLVELPALLSEFEEFAESPFGKASLNGELKHMKDYVNAIISEAYLSARLLEVFEQ